MICLRCFLDIVFQFALSCASNDGRLGLSRSASDAHRLVLVEGIDDEEDDILR